MMIVTVCQILLVSGWYKVENIDDALIVFAQFAVVGAVLCVIFALMFFYVINPLSNRRKRKP